MILNILFLFLFRLQNYEKVSATWLQKFQLPSFLPDTLTQSSGFFGKVRRNVKMIAHREDCLRIEVVSFLPCGLLLPVKHHEVQLQGN